MEIEEMENNGTIDYFLELRQYINEFIKRNYPLTKEDMASIIAGTPTENVIKREEVYAILNETLKEILKEVEDINNQMINLAKKGILIQIYDTKNVKQDLEKQKQRLLEALWKKQQHGEQQQNKPIDTKPEEKTTRQFERD